MATDPSFLSRRNFAVGGCCAAVAAGLSHAALAKTDSIGGLVRMLFGEKDFEEGRVRLNVPEIAENGMVVPVSVEVESPMTETSYVRSIHLYALDNPVPQVGAYIFTPASGRAAISTRIRLAKTQDLIAVAEMSDGTVHASKAPIKVVIGGCE